MRRVALWGFYTIGALAVGYLAMHALGLFTRPNSLKPGKPIEIYQSEDAPTFSLRAVPEIRQALAAGGNRPIRRG